jgi:hypothetical protein
MTPEIFFDYLEGKLPPSEKERLEHALISDPKLRQEFMGAREVHRGLLRSEPGETAATKRAGVRGRQVGAAFAVLVAMNVALGLIYIFDVNKPSAAVKKAREDALRHQLENSVEKSAVAQFPPPTIEAEPIDIAVPRAQRDAIAQKIIDAANKTGGSATKGLPNEKDVSVLVLIPASAEHGFRQMLATLGGPTPAPASLTPAAAPNEPVHLEIRLLSPP